MKLEKNPQPRGGTVRSFRLASAGHVGKNKSREIWAGILVFMMIFIFVSSTFNSGSPSRDNPVASPTNDKTPESFTRPQLPISEEPLITTQLPISEEATYAGCSEISQVHIPEYSQGEVNLEYDGEIPRLMTDIPIGGYYRHLKTNEKSNGRSPLGSDSGFGEYNYALEKMHEGYVIIWYNPHDLTTDEKRDIRKFVKTLYSKKDVLGTAADIIRLPWGGDSAALANGASPRPMPQGSSVAFSAWGFDQICSTWSKQAALDFKKTVDKHRAENPILNKKVGLKK